MPFEMSRARDYSPLLARPERDISLRSRQRRNCKFPAKRVKERAYPRLDQCEWSAAAISGRSVWFPLKFVKENTTRRSALWCVSRTIPFSRASTKQTQASQSAAGLHVTRSGHTNEVCSPSPSCSSLERISPSRYLPTSGMDGRSRPRFGHATSSHTEASFLHSCAPVGRRLQPRASVRERLDNNRCDAITFLSLFLTTERRGADINGFFRVCVD